MLRSFGLCYFEKDKHYLYYYLFEFLPKFPKDIVLILPISVITLILLTQHYTRIAWNRLPVQKMLGNETASTEVEKSTWKTHRYFLDFKIGIHVEISTSNRCHNFHVNSSFNINEVSMNFRRGTSPSN